MDFSTTIVETVATQEAEVQLGRLHSTPTAAPSSSVLLFRVRLPRLSGRPLGGEVIAE